MITASLHRKTYILFAFFIEILNLFSLNINLKYIILIGKIVCIITRKEKRDIYVNYDLCKLG